MYYIKALGKAGKGDSQMPVYMTDLNLIFALVFLIWTYSPVRFIDEETGRKRRRPFADNKGYFVFPISHSGAMNCFWTGCQSRKEAEAEIRHFPRVIAWIYLFSAVFVHFVRHESIEPLWRIMW